MASARKLNPYEEERRRSGERRCREQTCRRCGRPILLGLDNDVTAMTARADPGLLSAAEELLARADGRRSYRLRRNPRSGDDLWLRDRWQIKGEPANPHGGLWAVRVVGEHRCELRSEP